MKKRKKSCQWERCSVVPCVALSLKRADEPGSLARSFSPCLGYIYAVLFALYKQPGARAANARFGILCSACFVSPLFSLLCAARLSRSGASPRSPNAIQRGRSAEIKLAARSAPHAQRGQENKTASEQRPLGTNEACPIPCSLLRVFGLWYYRRPLLPSSLFSVRPLLISSLPGSFSVFGLRPLFTHRSFLRLLPSASLPSFSPRSRRQREGTA